MSSWADASRLFSLSNGEIYFWWPERLGSGRGGYNLMLSKSLDQGKSWTSLGKINQDDSASEHGFVSIVEDNDRPRINWIDGRDTLQGGASSLRTMVLSEKPGLEEVLDMRVCDCCGTSSVAVKNNILVFYRGRTSEETRDIQMAKRIDGKWSIPNILHRDKWKISGCPMNGPQAASRGSFVVVAWFTKAFNKSVVKIKISTDGGLKFEKPIVIDDSLETNLGRVGLDIIDEQAAIVSWLKAIPNSERAQLMAQKVSSAGKLGSPQLISEISSSKNSGFPVARFFKDDIYFTWTEPGLGIKVEKVSTSKF